MSCQVNYIFDRVRYIYIFDDCVFVNIIVSLNIFMIIIITVGVALVIVAVAVALIKFVVTFISTGDILHIIINIDKCEMLRRFI